MDYILSEVKDFDLAQTLDNGQCFRWQPTGDGYIGIAHGRQLQLIIDGNRLILKNMSPDEFENTWKEYFDLNRDYSHIKNLYSIDPHLAKATAFSPGLRVLQQDPWETLITFILSQNSNIPRIKKMVLELCLNFGKVLPAGGRAFPTPEALAPLTQEDMAPVKTGYRAPYIIDAARQIAEGKICLSDLADKPTDELKKSLLQIHGVGPKVAECTALFGFGRVEVCPMDVWMNRVMNNLYPNGFPKEILPTAGIAQQYLFHYARNVLSPSLRA
ncbi:MAG: DNA-3-methyladenine glycosylase 2 family protein [Defluviitaleaceae bacterium]|nr:DNA-3-methyladenine glycosylase 2 family protein [Defluviitaleaceae bacterium]